MAKDGYRTVVIDQAGDRVFAVNNDTEGIDVIDAKTGALVSSILSRADIEVLALDEQRKLLAAGGEHGVSIISTETLAVLSTIRVSGEPTAIAIDPTLGYLLIAAEHGKLSIVDLMALRVITEIELLDKPVSIAVDPTLHRAIVAHHTWGKGSDRKKSEEEKIRDNISIIDLSTLSVVATLLAGKEPVDVDVNPITHEAAVANEKSDDVTLIDLGTVSVKGTIPVDKHPSALYYNSCLNTLAVVGGEDRSWLRVIDPATQDVQVVSRYHDKLYDIGIHNSLNKAVLAGKSRIQFVALPNPIPHLDAIFPNKALRGGGPFEITLSGTGLLASTEVYLNGIKAESSFKACGTITISISATLLDNAGTIEIKATNPAPQGGTSNILLLAVENPVPSILALQPTQAAAGSLDLTLTIIGSGFFPNTQFFINSTPRAFTYLSATTIQTQLTAVELETGRYITISAVNPQPGGGSSLPSTFTVLNPVPAISSLSPAELTAGSSDTTVTITGDNFVMGSSVLLNGQPIATKYVGKTSIETTLAAAQLANPGSFAVEVSNPVPGGGSSPAVSLLVKPAGNKPDPLPDGSFGKQYEDLVPTNATIKAYDPKRFSIVTGLITDRTGNPVSGIQVSIHGHAEYGSATTDNNGRYSLPLDGGTTFTMVYQMTGLITSHRQVYVPWNDIAISETVTLIAADSKATTVTFDGNPTTVVTHRSTPVTDSFGSRSMTMVFTGDNHAYVTDENGLETIATTITTRATEFDTPESMPAVLPPTSAYTYCAELSADGAKHVRFEKPVVTYVENFLGFPVGSIVPVGYYDRAKGTWVASDNGVVVRLLDTNGDGIVDALDSTGDSLPDDLNNDGSFIDEVKGLSDAGIFNPGGTYWRVSVNHFTPYDHNWPYGPPEDAIDPNPERDPVQDKQQPCDAVDYTSSYCERKSRVFHEDVSLAGTDMTLHYASNRVQGYKTVISIPASGPTLPGSLKSIIVRMELSGRVFQRVLSPRPNQSVEFIWDGLDHLGRRVIGPKHANISIGYGYTLVYYSARSDVLSSWARVGDWSLAIPGRQDIIVWKHSKIYVHRDEYRSVVKGWTLSKHHHMTPWAPNLLIKGDGTTIDNRVRTISTIAGNFQQGYSGDGVPATQASLYQPAGVIADKAGNILFADHFNDRIRMVDTSGIISTVAGNGRTGFSGDGGLAVEASLMYPTGVALDNYGNLYIADGGNSRIRKVDSAGIITTIAGIGQYGYGGDGGPAVQAALFYPSGVAVDREGNVYIADLGNSRVRIMDASGIIRTFAGNGEMFSFSGDGGRAEEAGLSYPSGVAVDGSGNVYIADRYNGRIRKVDVRGIITTIAGSGDWWSYNGNSGDGGPAVEAFMVPEAVALDSVGNIYVADQGLNTIRKINTSGIITTIAGNGEYGYGGDGGLSTKAQLYYPTGVAVDPASNVYIADSYSNKIRKISELNVFALHVVEGDIPFADENGLGYIMGSTGLHKKTIDLASGITLLDFGYNTRGELISITDRFGSQTSIQWNAAGTISSITSPDGIVTSLTVDGNTHLTNISYQDGSSYAFGYTADGLMTDEYDRRNNHFIHQYAPASGRITSIIDPESGRWDYEHYTDATGTVFSSMRTAEGNIISYRDKEDLAGAYTSAQTDARGETTTTTLMLDGFSATQTDACGVKKETTFDIDSAFFSRYETASVVTTPAGLSRSRNISKSYADTNADNIPDISIKTVSLNDKIWLDEINVIAGTRRTTTPQGRNRTTIHNPSNLLITSIETTGLYSAMFGYDFRGRLTSATTGSRTSIIAYDAFGHYDYIITPDNRKFDYSYDRMGNLRSLQQPDGSVIRYDYDLSGNMTVLTNAKSVTNTFNYTANDQRKTWTTPLSGSYTYTFDKERKLKTVTYPSGRVLSNTYTNGLLAGMTTPEGSTTYSYGCSGQLSGAVRGSESIAFTYDGSLIKTDSRVGTVGQAISYTYNNDFNLSSITYAGVTQSLGYDNDGLLISAAPYAITRNAQNGLPEMVGDGNLTLSRTFSGYGELDQSVYAVSGTPLYSWTLSRDNAGRITQKIDVMPLGGVVWDYAYDTLGRLKEVKQSGSIVESYEYDANGNRTFETNTFRGTSNRAYAYSLEDHVLTAGQDTYQFDADGFLTRRTTSAGTATFTYSSRGELLSAALPDGRVLTYDHDPMGRRIAKRVNGTIIEKYLWQGATRLLAVYDNSNNLVMRFTYADGRMPVSMTKGGITYYLFYDQIGSLRAVVDGSGQIVKEMVYDSFGYMYNESNPAFTVPFGFAGGLYDRDTGLVRFGARDYDLAIGRWTAKDPIDFAGGDTNLFEYVFSSPINYTDSLGLVARWLVPDSIINNSQQVVNRVTNNAFSKEELAKLTNLVIKNIGYLDAIQFQKVWFDTQGNVPLTNKQKNILDNLFNELLNDADNQDLIMKAYEEYLKAFEEKKCYLK